MMSADETEYCSGAALRNTGTIHAQDRPLADTTTMLPPALLPTPETVVRATGS
jgi:hypothetical protein